MKHALVAIGLLATTQTGCADSSAHVHQVEAPDYSSDAAALREGLLSLYPSLDRFGQGEDVIAALDQLDRTAASARDPMVFYRAVADVAAATKDEHVIPFPSDAYRASRREAQVMLPYTVQWAGNQPFIASVSNPEFAVHIGQRVVAFDGTPASRVLSALSATIPSDGLSGTFAIRRLQDFTPTQNENYFDLNYPIWFGSRASYSVTIEGQDGQTERVEMDALTWSQFREFYADRLPRPSPVAFRWLRDDVGYLSVLSFHDWYYEQQGVDPEAFFAEVVRELTSREGASLILDLRRNEGGGDVSSLLLDFLLQRPFVEYDRVLTSFVGRPDAARHCENANEVAFDPGWSEPGPDGLFQLRDDFKTLITGALERQPRPDAFSGELVVLISGATGSAAAKVSAVLDREDRAVFVGEETGGAAAGATAFGYCRLSLPQSGISVELPLVRFERELAVPYGRGVLPDIEVDWGLTPPVSNSDQGIDTALTFIERG